MRDLRLALRRLARGWRLVIPILLIATPGSGPSATVFSLLRSSVLHALPYPQSERLAVIWNVTARSARSLVAPMQIPQWREQRRFIAGLAAIRFQPRMVLAGITESQQVQAVEVSPSLFDVLEIRPEIGRAFTELDSQRSVLLSYHLWQTQFGGDKAVPGRQVRLGDNIYTIVGVMPRGFDFPHLLYPMRDAFDLWLPLVFKPQQTSDPSLSVTVIARLVPGVRFELLSRRLSLLVPPRLHQSVSGVNVMSMHEAIVGDVQRALVLVTAAVGFVLLLASANLANLFLSRIEAQRVYAAIRLALGATVARIIGEFVWEFLMLAVAAALLGTLTAYWTIPVLAAALPPQFPLLSQPGLTWSVAAATLVCSIGLFSLAALLSLWSAGLGARWSDTFSMHATPSPRRQRVRSALVITEIALAVMLSAVAFTTARAYWKLVSRPLGYQPEHVLAAPVSLPGNRYTSPERLAGFAASFTDSLRGTTNELYAVSTGIPGIYAGGSANVTRTLGSETSTLNASLDAVSGDYFRVMGIPQISGRSFGIQDRTNGKPVVILDTAAAQALGLGPAAVGRQIVLDSAKTPVEVVGLVGNVRLAGRGSDKTPHIYLPFSQSPIQPFMLIVRTLPSAPGALSKLRRKAKAIDPDVAFGTPIPLKQRIEAQTGGVRFHLVVLGVSGILALLLAAAGVFSVMDYMLSLRMREIAIRSSLGAQSGSLIALLASSGIKLLAYGSALGLFGALLLSQSISDSLPDVKVTELAGPCAAVIAVGMAAVSSILISALRTMRTIDTAALLREF